MSIKMKILVPMIALTILVAAAILISNVALFTDFVDESMLQNITTASTVAMDSINTLKESARAASLMIAENPAIISAAANSDRDTLLSQAKRLQDEMGVEFCTITDPAGTVILRTHEPENYGDSLTSQANIQAAMAGKGLTAIEQGSAVRLSVRSGMPVLNESGSVVGIVSVGYRLDTEEFVDSIKALLRCETTIFLGDERISTTVLQEDGTRAIGTKANANVSQAVLAGENYTGQTAILNRATLASYTPIEGPDGQPLGMLFVGYYMDASERTIQSFVQTGLLITLIMLAIAIALILIVVRRIVMPIHAMVKAASDLAAGETDIDIQVHTKDEMRALADAFGHMVENTGRQVQIIKSIADGDLTVTPQARSEKDLMNNAIISMLDLNNSVFTNIAGSAGQVANASQQITDSSQALAQGSTEQAASIAELSDSIAEISKKTKANADTADKTAKLAETIRFSAEKSNRQMDEMISAVKEINQSSQNIGKVIKVIDDIAFQTNILALNAAVEAARAGQHGKGFAVVAEEVRNLASKSAEAARDTGSMIQDSINKADLGSRIANETAVSLTEIISGINESNQLIAEIAQSSEDQAQGISQINTGIDQIAQVVQQNSATAEENAAASQEMNWQSSVLQEMIAKFRLRDGNVQTQDQLPPPAEKGKNLLNAPRKDDFSLTNGGKA